MSTSALAASQAVLEQLIDTAWNFDVAVDLTGREASGRFALGACDWRDRTISNMPMPTTRMPMINPMSNDAPVPVMTLSGVPRST